MKILPDVLEFEWDEGNSHKIVAKHSVSEKEVEEAFENTPVVLFDDQKHSDSEKRYGLLGRTNTYRLLSIVFTIRKKKIRIVTARPMSKKERRGYEKVQKTTTV